MPKIRRRNPSKFQKISDVQKLYVQEEDLTILLLKLFLLTVSKNFLGETFGFSKRFSYRKFVCTGGGFTVLTKRLCLTGPINFVGNSFVLQQTSVFKIFFFKFFIDKRRVV